MRNFSRDIRFEVRQLSRTPAFTATAVLTLSFAIGSATAIYSVVGGVLLRPLPFADPQNLAELGDMIDGNDSEDLILPANESILLTRNTHSFQSLGAFQWLAYELSGPIPAARITASRLNASVFATLGVSPLIGRVFTPEEDTGRAPWRCSAIKRGAVDFIERRTFGDVPIFRCRPACRQLGKSHNPEAEHSVPVSRNGILIQEPLDKTPRSLSLNLLTDGGSACVAIAPGKKVVI